MKNFIAALLAFSVHTSYLHAADKTICQDQIGSQIVIDYRESLGRTGTVNGKPVTKVEYTISGPAAQTKLSYQGENPAHTTGYLREDGTLHISFTHARSNKAYDAYWDHQGRLVVIPLGEDLSVSAWEFQNCWDI